MKARNTINADRAPFDTIELENFEVEDFKDTCPQCRGDGSTAYDRRNDTVCGTCQGHGAVITIGGGYLAVDGNARYY